MFPTSAVDSEVSVADELRSDLGKSAMTFFEIDPLLDPRWRIFAERHPDSSVFHRVEWLQALQSCYGYVPVALSSTPPGSALEDGILFCEVRSAITGNRLVSVPFSDHCEPLMKHPEQIDLFASSLVERVEKQHWKYFEIRPIESMPGPQTNLLVSNTYYFHRLDLRPSEHVLFKGLQKDSIQRKIRRAERESLRYEKGSSDRLLNYFYKLMIMTRRKHGLPPQPLKWFRSLVTCMANDLEIRVALTGETPIASILTISNKKTLVYKYGCSDGRFNNLGGTAMLFWKAIQEAKANGMEEFDLGRSDVDNPGLITFKDRWGAKRSTLNYWRYPFRPSASKPKSLVRYAKRIVSIAPDISLVALGNLLYRHIG
jgi:CelD/BcsL family acetyltransferase involved in cellulose biosynthesis